MKGNKAYIVTIVVLAFIVLSMGVKMILMNRDLGNNKNTIESLEKIIEKFKVEAEEKCPDKFNFDVLD